MMLPRRSATPVLESLTFYVQIYFMEAKTSEFCMSWVARVCKSIYGTEQNKAGVFELLRHVVSKYLDLFR